MELIVFVCWFKNEYKKEVKSYLKKCDAFLTIENIIIVYHSYYHIDYGNQCNLWGSGKWNHIVPEEKVKSKKKKRNKKKIRWDWLQFVNFW